MRLNRKWLYLGGLVAMLTLLLTLTWVLPAGAVGQLDEGDVSVDKDYVSPSVTSGTDAGLGARTVEVTLANDDLTSTEAVGPGADLGPVTIAFASPVDVTTTGALRVQLNLATISASGGATATVPDGDDDDTTPDTTVARMNDILPIVGEVSVHRSTPAATRAKLGTPVVINRKNGLIEFPLLDSLAATDSIVLSYDTSNSETALVNIRGEDDFDLLLVEDGTQGEYSETFSVNEPSNVRMTNASVIHEQHSIPSGLSGYLEIDNESISTFYLTYAESTGALTGAQAFLDDLAGRASETDTVGISANFYARVANPPIRGTIAADGTEATPTITHDAPAGVSVTIEDAQQGVLLIDPPDDFAGFSGGDIEVDYTGSDSFEIVVEHGPISLGTVTDLSAINLNDDWDGTAGDPYLAFGETGAEGTIGPGNIRIGLPTTDDDSPAPVTENIFDLVSLTNDGNNCDNCRLRIGVRTTPDDGSDPVALKSRYSVLAISYSGSERLDIPDNLDESRHNVDTDDSGDDDVYAFSRTLAFAPHGTDADDDDILQADEYDISVIANTHAGILDTEITVAAVRDRRVTFHIDLTDLARLTDATPPVTNEDPATRATGNDTFDITYTRRVGALPQNALNPDASLRPVAAVANGGRIRVSSDNDVAAVDAETDGPIFSNVMPAHKSGTASNDEMLSIDVTDDLAGVDDSSIEFMVKAGGAATRTVVNDDLTITEIDGGFRASIALDDVRHNGTGSKLNVSTTRETAINWYAMAEDMAGNMGSSDSNPDERDDADADNKYADCSDQSAGSDDCYTFTVDGVAPVMQRAYTGDWFNVAMERVEGDRRVSRDNYLRGSSKNTSVRVVFNEPIDPASVSADDFTVDGSVPDDADAYSSASGSTDGANGEDAVNGVLGRSVFLTVAAMGTGETPMVELTGSVDDLAGNSATSGSETANDGLAPNAVLSVDTTIHKKTVTVTVETDEAVRLQSPDLLLWVSNAVDMQFDEELDEVDTFTVGYQTEGDDESPLVIRDGSDEIIYEGELDEEGTLNVTLANAPLLDRTADGTADHRDIEIGIVREGDDVSQADTGVGARMPISEKVVRDAEKGQISLTITGPLDELVVDENTPATPTDPADDTTYPAVPALANGDRILVTYRGTGPDPANQFPTVPTVRGVPVTGSPNTWTYELDITRDDRFAVTAEMEDSEFNRGTGGVPDPMGEGATVFEIDGELAGNTDTDATMTRPDDNGSAAISDPFIIDLTWGDEANEYPGDSHNNVTLTKAMLNGMDVLDDAARQSANSWRIRVSEITLGDYTLVYNAMDDAGNTNVSDRTLEFEVTERPTWELDLKDGMNLVSLPSAPANGDIDAVFGTTPQVDLIFTFQGGLVRVAVRNPGTGGFAGSLTTIDAQHAYWIRTTNSVKVEINIPSTAQTSVLPSIRVMGGEWNLVPVLSLGSISSDVAGEGAAPGTLVDADAYLGDFQVAFGWDEGRWNRIDPDPVMSDGSHLTNDITVATGSTMAAEGDDPLKVGMGYWVLYTDDAFIVPR